MQCANHVVAFSQLYHSFIFTGLVFLLANQLFRQVNDLLIVVNIKYNSLDLFTNFVVFFVNALLVYNETSVGGIDRYDETVLFGQLNRNFDFLTDFPTRACLLMQLAE